MSLASLGRENQVKEMMQSAQPTALFDFAEVNNCTELLMV